MATIKDLVVDLVLRAKNTLSKDTDAAASSVRNLSGSTEELTAGLRELQDQGRLIAEMQKSAAAVDRTSAAYERAKARVETLQERIAATGTATAKQARDLDLAKDAVARTDRAYREAQRALNAVARESQAAGIDIANLNEEQRSNARATVAHKRALEDLKAETAETGSGLKQLAARVVALVGAYASFRTVTNLVREVLGTGDRFEKLSLQMAAVMGSLAAGERATAWITDFAKSTPLQLDEVTESFLRLKNFGLDPMDGTLQAIVDQNEKLGGGQERLQGIANALGQAWAKQKLQGEEILQLIERGVPVYELLAKATGKTTAELQDMATKGQLTRDVIRAMIGEMGEASAGAAAANMSTLSGLISNLRDRWTEWLNTVAESGALEYARELLQRVSGQIESLAASGALADWAQRTSDAIVTVAQQLEGFARGTASQIGDIGASAQRVIDVFQFLGNAGLTAFRVAQAGIAGLVTIAATGLTAISKLVELVLTGLNRIGAVSDDALAAARATTQNLLATVEDLTSQTTEYGRGVRTAGAAALTAFNQTAGAADRARDATAGAADAAGNLATAVEQQSESVAAAVDATEAHAATQQQLGEQIAATVRAIEEANAAWSNDPSEANLERVQQLRAEYHRLQDELRALAATKQDVDEAGESLDTTAKAARSAADGSRELAKESEAAGDSLRETARQATETAASTGAALGAIADMWARRVAALSAGATAAFRRAIGLAQAADDAGTLEHRLAAVDEQLARLGERVAGGGLARPLVEMARAALSTERSFLSQALAAEQLEARVRGGELSVRDLDAATAQLEQRFSLLDGQRLEGLRSALADARATATGLAEAMQQAVAANARELAGLRGDLAEVERLGHVERQLELQDQLNRARALGDQQAVVAGEQALRQLEEIHALRLQQLAERSRAEEQRRTADQDLAGVKPALPAPTSHQQSAPATHQVIELHAAGRSATVTTDNPSALLEVLAQAGLRTGT